MERNMRLWVNPFTIMAGLYVSVGLFFAVLKGLAVLPEMPGPSNLNWLRVHVITVGTITQMIFAALPAILSRRLSLPERPAREGWVQWFLLNGGFLLAVTGLVGVDGWTASIGATLVIVAIYRLLMGLLRAWRESGRPYRESFRFYATAPVYLLVGLTMAISLLLNLWAPGGRIGILEAHVHANVWGFLALVVAGMLFDLFPVLTGGPMARANWIGRTYHLINLGAIGLVAGPWINLHAMTIGGLLTYFAGTGALLLNLILTLRLNRRVTAASLHLVLAYLWMVVPAFFAPFILLAPGMVDGPAVEAAATQGLVNGWVLGVVMGALPRILRNWRLADGPLFGVDGGKADGCWLSVAALNAGVALVWATAVVTDPTVDSTLTLAGYALIAVAWVPFLRRIWPSLTAQHA